MNTAYGDPAEEQLPFDLRHLRHPICYCLKEDDDGETKSAVQAELAKKLADALSLILREGKQDVSTTQIEVVFERQPTTENPSTFFQDGERVETPGRGLDAGVSLEPDVEHLFLRLVPSVHLTNISTSLDARQLIIGHLHPMGIHMSGWSHERNVYGAMSYHANDDGRILNMSQLFLTGELWGIDAYLVDAKVTTKYSEMPFAHFAISLVEQVFAKTLTNYLECARDVLHLKPPLLLIAGATGVKGFRLGVGNGYEGNVLHDSIVHESTIEDLDADVLPLLRPFYEYFWKQCGVVRPDVDIAG